MKNILIVSAPTDISRGDFIDAWFEQEFASESDFNEAWAAYVSNTMEHIEGNVYEEEFEIFTVSEICVIFNDDLISSDVRWLAPVIIG